MGRLAAIVGERSSIATPEQWLIDWFKGGAQTPAGIAVTEDTALHYGPFFAGVRILSEDLGSLPFPLYESLEPKGKRRAKEHPLYSVLHDAANDVMSSQVLRETLTGHAIMWGGGFAEIIRRRGVVIELWPLRPDRMKVKLNRRTRALVYHYDDQTNGIRRTFLPDEILHIHGLGFDGAQGYSVLELARNSIGAGIASETYGATFFGNAARPSGVLEHPGRLGEAARTNLRDSWEGMHKGATNANRIAILEEGITWKQIGIPPEDAQFLETKRHDVLEMARWLRLPPYMLAELGRATWNNIESEKIDYVTKSLRTWLTRWESAVWMRLLDSEERKRLFAKHVVEGLLRGDMKSRFESYRIGREMGVYSADDILELEDRNPLPNQQGEVYFVPLNWAPAPTPAAAAIGNGGDPRRSSRSAEARRRIASAFRPLLEDTELRLAKIERNQVGRLVKKHFTEATPPSARRNSTSAFAADVADLYEGEILTQATDRWGPLMATFADQITTEAAAEVAFTGEVDLTGWIIAYVSGHAGWRVSASTQKLIAAADAAKPEEVAFILAALLDKWVSERPGQVALQESIQMANAAAREVWRSAGVTSMRWVATGQDCPFCQRLDGTIVGTESPFMAAGSSFEGTDGQLLPVERNTFHPPAHGGCDCMVVAQ